MNTDDTKRYHSGGIIPKSSGGDIPVTLPPGPCHVSDELIAELKAAISAQTGVTVVVMATPPDSPSNFARFIAGSGDANYLKDDDAGRRWLPLPRA